MPGPWESYQTPGAVTVPLGPRDPNKVATDALDLDLKRAQLAKAQKDAAKEQVGDKQVEALAKLYAANKLVPPARPNEVAQKAIARAMELDPDFDPELASNRAKAIKDFSGNGQASQVVRSVNRLANHLNDMFNASEKMGGPNLGIRPINKLIASIEQQGQPTTVAAYDAAKPFVATELEKIMKGAGQPTVSGIAEAMAGLDRARSLDERRAAFKQIGALVHGALDPIKQSWNSAYGGTKAPPMWVSPQAGKIFGHIDPDNADTFGGDEWRGLPGLKGDGTPGQGTPPDNGGGAAGGLDMTTATGATKTEITRGPMDKKIAAMLSSGTPSANIRAFASANGYTKNLESVLAYRAMHPGYKGGYDVHQETIVPTTVANRMAASPFAAGALSAVDAGTAGLVDEATGAVNALRSGNPIMDEIASADYAKQLQANTNPKASLAGSVIGGAGAMIGGGMGLKALLAGGAKAGLGRNALAWAARRPKTSMILGDMGYGAAYGAGENNDNRAMGAGVGAVTGAGGSVLGQGVSKVLGAGVRGVVDPAVQRLRARGIPLTVGETLGGGWKKAQDAMTSVFGPGNMVEARYLDGRRALNAAGFNEGGAVIGKEINQTGQAGVNALDAAKTQAYSGALDPVTLNLNTPYFIDPMMGVKAGAAAIPAGELPQGYGSTAIDRFVGNNIMPDGTMNGRDFQKAYRGLAQTAARAAPKVEGHDISQSLGQAKDVLATALETQNPGAYAGFLKANSANRHLNILANAVEAAKNQPEQLWTPAQLNAAASANANKFSGKIAAASGDKPFNQLALDAQRVMSSKIGESGTVPRLLLASLATGGVGAAGTGAGYVAGGGEGAGVGGVGTLALLTALGTRTGQAALTAALLKRAAPFRKGGQWLVDNPQYLGDMGAAFGATQIAQPGTR